MLKCGFFETDITGFTGSQVPGGFKTSTLQAIDDPMRAQFPGGSGKQQFTEVIFLCAHN